MEVQKIDGTSSNSFLVNGVVIQSKNSGVVFRNQEDTIDLPVLSPAIMFKNGIFNLKLQNHDTTPDTKITIRPGACDMDDNSMIVETTETIDVDLDADGLNGLDSGAKQANTWYYIFLILKPDQVQVGGLISASMTPTLPPGFTKKRRIGSIFYGPNRILRFLQYGEGINRNYLYLEDQETILCMLMNGGETTFTEVDLSSRIPNTSRLAHLQVKQTIDGGQAHIRCPDQMSGKSYSLFHKHSAKIEQPVCCNQRVEYMVENQGDLFHLAVLGFMEEL